MKNISVFFLVFGFWSLICHASPSPTAIEPFNEGVKRFNASQFSEAIPCFDRALSHDGNFADAYYARGACHHALHHIQDALVDLNHAVQLNPQLVDAFSLRGAISYEGEQWDVAFRDFDYVLSIKPNDAQSLLGRGAIHIQREKLALAEKDFRAFLLVRPNDPMAPRVRKILASLSKSSEEASASEEPATRPAAGTPSRPPTSSRRATSAKVTPAMKQMTAELFFQSHRVSEAAAQKAARGEQVTATGDLNTIRR